MKPEELLSVLHTANRLKDTTRHCWTPGNRHESVADHSWRLALTAFFLRDEFPDTDMDKVIKMCLIHDLGECFTGDIPSFLKTDADTATEDALLIQWVETLPQPYRAEMAALYAEMDALETPEAKLYKALDKLAEHLKKMPKAIQPVQITEVKQRLRALDAVRPKVPIPKGPMPTMKGANRAMRGR